MRLQKGQCQPKLSKSREYWHTVEEIIKERSSSSSGDGGLSYYTSIFIIRTIAKTEKNIIVISLKNY